MYAKWIEEDGRFAFERVDNGGIVITDDEHGALFEPDRGSKVIVLGSDGRPALQEPPLPTSDELALVERTWRDKQLAVTDGVVTRHRDEIEDGIVTTLTSDQYGALQTYRRALRNWPEAGEFPLIDHRPPAPDWLAMQHPQ
ncbi:phage tail protein [Pseudomonas brassicacearum]|uniref:phage tail protein n=1 Tax=Pseudomonas brassicacearum TaxID=930166 RepID=UPI0018692F7B|nr:phage tail protein [Pseudomonas brassicacearum]QOD67347.1 phage tail protein [Pseudomonas brassicacearum]